MAQSIFMIGALVGGLVLGMFSDKYGRRLAWCISYVLMVCGGLATSFATSLNLFYLTRLLAGIGCGGVILTGFVLVTELIGPSYRGITGTLSSCFFTFGQMLLPALAYFFDDWRKLSFTLSLLGAVFIFFIRSVIIMCMSYDINSPFPSTQRLSLESTVHVKLSGFIQQKSKITKGPVYAGLHVHVGGKVKLSMK